MCGLQTAEPGRVGYSGLMEQWHMWAPHSPPGMADSLDIADPSGGVTPWVLQTAVGCGRDGRWVEGLSTAIHEMT